VIRIIRPAAIAVALLVAFPAPESPAAELQTKAGVVNVEPLAKLDNPWGMTFLPDGMLLITEKPGRMRFFEGGKLSNPIGGVPKVAFRGQGGLLDVEIDPKFAENKLVYISYAEPAAEQPPGTKDDIDQRLGTFFRGDDPQIKNGAVARAKLDGNELKDLKVIWRQEPQIGRGHFGGRLIFAPDGKLFILSGERQRFEPAQDPRSALGGVVRINADGSVPQDNPFAGKDGYRPDLYTKGNRNPLGGAIYPPTGELWINEMGPKGGDELNVIKPGRNYGWPVVCEGTHYNDAPIPHHDTRPEFEKPLKFWNPVISPSGMMFYNGSKFPQWKGNAFIGGLSSKALIRLAIDNGKVAEEERLNTNFRVRDMIEAPDGAILLLSDGPQGELLRLTPKNG
jgi:aldose sugar dehydrogenase